jgi:hypothetical protein
MDTETLKKLHRIYNQTNSFGKELMEKEFPELKESEDERIRKEIIRIVDIWTNSSPTVNGIPAETLLAWLEKQGELVNSLSKRIDGLIQKNNSLIEQLEKQGEQPNPYSGISFEYDGHIWGMCARDNGVDILLDKQLLKHLDKTEPKFKIEKGQWYVCIQSFILNGNTVVAEGRTYKSQEDNAISGEDTRLFIDKLDGDASEYFRLWTIQDAKDGDVFTTHISPEGDWIGMYKQSTDDTFNTYCFLNSIGEFVVNPNRCKNHGTHGLHPATKEQRDLLFTKMKEAGYYWDAEKRELRKVEQEDDSELTLTDFESVLFSAFSDAWQEYLSGKTVNIAKWTREHSAELLEVARKQKPTDWSEEDERMLDSIIEDVMPYGEIDDYPTDEEREYFQEGDRKVDWLKSLKERIK